MIYNPCMKIDSDVKSYKEGNQNETDEYFFECRIIHIHAFF